MNEPSEGSLHFVGSGHGSGPTTHRHTLTVILPLAVGLVVTARAQPSHINAAAAPQQAIAFLNRVQDAFQAPDRHAMAALVSYPVTVLVAGFNIPVKDERMLLSIYASVFTPELRCRVVSSRLQTVALPNAAPATTVSRDGLTVANGTIWAPFKDGRFRISRIRVPASAPTVAPRRGVERVNFRNSRTPQTVAYTGWLNVDAYIVDVGKGRRLEARIEGFCGHDATIRAMPASNARSSSHAVDQGRKWTGIATDDSAYRVQVVHLAAYCDPPQRYKLTLSVQYARPSAST